MFDEMYAIHHTLSQALRFKPAMRLMNDSKSLFDVFSKESRASERRFIIDSVASRGVYENKEIDNIGLIRSEDNVADGVTKPNKQAAIHNILATGMHVPTIAQWILRHTKPSSR